MNWDSETWRKERNQKLLSWFKGDADAAACFIMLSSACEVWDDLIDGDSVAPEAINGAFADLFLHLYENPFYRRHHERIMGVMLITINAWHDANAMVSSGDKDAKIKAYVLRNLGLELIPLFAYLTGGHRHMREISGAAREFMAHETFEDWTSEHV